MGTREIPLPWGSQPTEIVGINTDHWLAQNLIFASDGQIGYVWHEPAPPAVAGLQSLPVSAAGPLGGIHAWVPDGSGYVRWAIPPRPADGITLGVWVQGVTGDVVDTLLAVSHSTAANGGRSLARTNQETYQAKRWSTIAAAAAVTSASAAVAGRWDWVVGTYSSGTVSDIWLNAVRGSSGAGNNRPATTVDSVVLGAFINGGTLYERATASIRGIGPAYVLDRVLSPDEVVAWSMEALADPWGLFAPQAIPVTDDTAQALRALCLANGVLLDQEPASGDRRVYLTPAGHLYAAESGAPGDRLLVHSGGLWQAITQ